MTRIGTGLALCALVGCSQVTSTPTNGPVLPASAGPEWPADWRPTTGLPRPTDVPTIDVTQDNVHHTWHCTSTPIDTWRFADQHQLHSTWDGPTQRPGTLLPPHKHQKPPAELDGPPNDLRAGSLRSGTDIGNLWGFESIAQTPWTPPDPTLAVGPDHVLVTVNMAIAWYDKDTGDEQFSAYLDSTGSPGFFEDIGGGDFTFDPKCFYDHHAERFVVMALEYYDDTQESWITIAVSDDSDPNGIWHKYRTWSVVQNGNETHWVDYPGFGFDADAYYVTGNLFGLGDGSGWGGVLYRVLEKAPLLTGDEAIIHDIRRGSHGSVQAAQVHGDSDHAWFVGVRDSTRMRVVRILDHTAPSVQNVNVDIPSFSSPGSDAPNPGGGINTLDGRMMNAHWRDGHLYACHAIDGGPNTVSRWYDFDVSNPSSPTLHQSGEIDPASNVHTYFPAIAANAHGDVAMVVGRCTSSDIPSVQVTGRMQSDPAGTMGALTQTAVGTHGADGRYGDYFDLTVDPEDDTTFWYVGEYSLAAGWQCHVGRFTITEPSPACPADVNGDGVVGVNDILDIIAAWGTTDADADVNGNGVVDASDILDAIAAWGPCA